MLQRKLCILALLGLSLSACREDVSETTCGSGHHADFVGQTIADITPPEGARVIGPDTAVTRDYRVERLNIDHDADGMVTRLWCG